MRKSRLASIAITALAGIACEGLTCTLAGCTSGVWIELTRTTRDVPALVRVLSQGTEIATFTCDGAGTACGSRQIPNQTPQTVTVEVTVGDRKTTIVATPLYTVNSPNGTECGPNCRQSTVKVEA